MALKIGQGGITFASEGTVTDASAAVLFLIQELIPNIPQHRLELDHAHRALGPPRSDGLPKDIVVKLHFYAAKKEVMHCGRSVPQLMFQDHSIQIFADLSATTIRKVCSYVCENADATLLASKHGADV